MLKEDSISRKEKALGKTLNGLFVYVHVMPTFQRDNRHFNKQNVKNFSE